MENKSNKQSGVILNCGWGRLIFAHTFPDAESVAECILQEEPGKRDIAFYLTDPHIVLNSAPQALFLDPSHTYRLKFDQYESATEEPTGFRIEPLTDRKQLKQINRIYSTLNMVSIDEDYVWHNRESDKFQYRVAVSEKDGSLLGVSMGVDHMQNFNDLLNGSSLWSLAVDPQAEYPKIGEHLVRAIIEYFQDQGREMLDLSVMHDNSGAIHLYKKLNFEKVAVFAVKLRNSINEKLFIGSPPDSGFNPYAKIIIDEALRRGIEVEPLDPKSGYFRLSLGGRSVVCRESLTDQTSAIALSRCDNKELTKHMLNQHGLKTADQIIAGTESENAQFLEKCGSVVVKPSRGEQGQGISVDIREPHALQEAIAEAKEQCETVLLEKFISGADLRVIVINDEVVAAAVRKPPIIVGTGKHTAEELISRLSRRRSAATGGESKIPFDSETQRCLDTAGFKMDDVLEEGVRIQVRKTANLHTGGTIHDVTDEIHEEIRKAAVKAAQVLEIPVTGLDFILPTIEGTDYIIIEANERPGLANHEPQPTAEKFLDFLFPQTRERREKRMTRKQ